MDTFSCVAEAEEFGFVEQVESKDGFYVAWFAKKPFLLRHGRYLFDFDKGDKVVFQATTDKYHQEMEKRYINFQKELLADLYKAI